MLRNGRRIMRMDATNIQYIPGNEECLDEISEPAWIVPFVYGGRYPVLSIAVYGFNNLLKFTK